MNSIAEYRHRAEECRALAGRALAGDHRNILLKIAQTWVPLPKEYAADSRRARIARSGEPGRRTTAVAVEY
jgi:hypothetical protein